jgi:hypothetical protein
MIDRLFLSEILWDLKNRSFIHHPLKVGDSLWFLPSIRLFEVKEVETGSYGFDHLAHNLYQTRFKVIQKFPNQSFRANRFHYLLEVLPGLVLFHFNWLREHWEYLQVGKWYQAFGMVSGAGDPAEENPQIDWQTIDQVIRKGVIQGILVVHNNRDYLDRFAPYTDQVFSGRSGLEPYGFPDDFQGLKAKLETDPSRLRKLQSTEQRDDFNVLVFVMGLIRENWKGAQSWH